MSGRQTGIIVAQKEELATVEILASKNSNTTHLMTLVIVDLSKDVIELSGPVTNIDQLVNVFPNYFERRRSLLQDGKFILVRRLNGTNPAYMRPVMWVYQS